MIWNRNTLGEIYKMEGGSVQTGPFGSQLHESDYTEFGIPVIMPKDIVDDQLDLTNIAHISIVDAERLSQHIVQKNDIVCPRRGEIGKRVIINNENVGAFCGTGCIRLRGNGSILNPLFLFYFLKQPRVVKWIENQAIGATMMNLNTSILNSIPITYPSLSVQNEIVSLLLAHDNLIENNKQRITLLEELAEDIYKEWFVRLRFPGYESTKFLNEAGNELKPQTGRALPIDWQRLKLGSVLASIKRKPKLNTDQYLTNGIFPIIDQGEAFISAFTNEESFVHYEPLPIVVFGDHTRRIKYLCNPFASGADGTQLLYPKNKSLLPIYFYLAIKNIDLSNFHYARHFKFLKQELMLIPDNNTLLAFNELVTPYFDEINVINAKNLLLQQTRDLLLPRLISGKLSVEHLAEQNPEGVTGL